MKVTPYFFVLLFTVGFQLSGIGQVNRYTRYTPPRYIETRPSNSGSNFEIMMRLAEVVEKRRTANSEYRNGLISWIDGVRSQNPDAQLLSFLLKKRSRLSELSYKQLGQNGCRQFMDEVRIDISNQLRLAEERYAKREREKLYERERFEANARMEKEREKQSVSRRFSEELSDENYISAMSSINRLIQLDSQNAESYFKRGWIKGLLQDYRGAESDYSKAIQLNPQDGVLYLARGGVNLMLDRRDDACLDFSKSGELGVTEAFELIKTNCQ
jgi:tetratricopeptide (TPR) repeat protein